jgi:hypothetical protein
VKYNYYAIDEFGDKFRRFSRLLEAKAFVKKRPGWSIIKERRIIAPIIDWNNFEQGFF